MCSPAPTAPTALRRTTCRSPAGRRSSRGRSCAPSAPTSSASGTRPWGPGRLPRRYNPRDAFCSARLLHGRHRTAAHPAQRTKRVRGDRGGSAPLVSHAADVPVELAPARLSADQGHGLGEVSLLQRGVHPAQFQSLRLARLLRSPAASGSSLPATGRAPPPRASSSSNATGGGTASSAPPLDLSCELSAGNSFAVSFENSSVASASWLRSPTMLSSW